MGVRAFGRNSVVTAIRALSGVERDLRERLNGGVLLGTGGKEGRVIAGGKVLRGICPDIFIMGLSDSGRNYSEMSCDCSSLLASGMGLRMFEGRSGLRMDWGVVPVGGEYGFFFMCWVWV